MGAGEGNCNTKSGHAFVNQSKTKRKMSSPQGWFNSSGMEKPKFFETPSLSPSKSLITFHYRITFTFNYSVKYNVINKLFLIWLQKGVDEG